MIKLSDYVADFLLKNKVKHVFMITGGGAMHLNDSLAKYTNEQAQNLEVIFNHHEQACAIAAESYARLSNSIAVVNVTSGPGGINALNGVFGAWTDSLPMLVLSGQVKYATTIRATNSTLRQMGDQEYDIISSVKPMTKYAEMVIDPLSIRYHLEKALYLACHDRPGPVWLDIPLDVQSAMISPSQLRGFETPIAKINANPASVIAAIFAKIMRAKRPIILVGTGVRISGAYEQFLNVAQLMNIPICTAFNAHDAVTDDHELFVGKAGTVGDRAGNFSVQNSDLLLILGCRLNIRQISYNFKSFARAAYKIMVDVDEAELSKPTLNIDMPVLLNLKIFFAECEKYLYSHPLKINDDWLQWCQLRKKKYPVVEAHYWEREDLINPYCFMERLCQLSKPKDIIVTANATACITSFQAWKIKPGQRLYSNSGCASMGYDLPAAIGACIAADRKPIICIAGDGSVQMNLQELATIRQYQLPIKIFILNNGGYHSIRQTQKNYFAEPLVGVGKETGLFFPHFDTLCKAYELQYFKCDQHGNMDAAINDLFAWQGPGICEVFLTQDQGFAPKTSSRRLPDGRMVSSPLEDLAPFLDRDEFAQNMLIDEYTE